MSFGTDEKYFKIIKASNENNISWCNILNFLITLKAQTNNNIILIKYALKINDLKMQNKSFTFEVPITAW